jgi:hypothetical protein
VETASSHIGATPIRIEMALFLFIGDFESENKAKLVSP